MATTANLPPGATPAIVGNDPFVSTPSQNHAGALRYAQFDADQFSTYSTNSPSQAKRALEAHLKGTDRRIQDASKLGTTLLQQRKDLAARLQDVEQVQQDNEVPSELRKKLAELEKEYNEVGKESARAFLPKSRSISGGPDITLTPSTLTGTGAQSPTKAAAQSRKQRNQPSNRVHDIEFATEISTQLLAQVRQLQGALAEKDDALKDVTSVRAQLEADAVGMRQRMKHMDENEQRYKDENWNLETRLQDLEASFKGSTDKEQRLVSLLKATESEKTAAQRDLDDLKASHDKLSEEHAVFKRQQETDLNGLRRDVATHDTEKQKLQKKIEELTSQNTELARGLAYRWNQPSAATDTEFATADEDQHTSDGTPDESAPASPVKGTPRHGMLESETLKSSLNHAHRMIQNLKNNIHREKTEKIELKRMLQEARDELETRRSENGMSTNLAKKRRSDNDSVKFKKPLRPDRLGANRSSTTEVLEDEPDWEEYDGARTPSKSRVVSGSMPGGFATTDPESTDAFETANEREGTSTDAFETGREGGAGDDSDELTETESTITRGGTIKGVSPLVGAKAGDRRSFQSTASTEDDEPAVRTPVQAAQPKYKLRMQNRDSKRSLRASELAGESPMQSQHSPSSSFGTPQPAGQSLGDELDAMDEDSIEGTPSSQRTVDSAAATPETQRQASVDPETPKEEDAEEEEHEPEIGSPVASQDLAKPEGEQANLAHQANSAMLAHEFAINKPNYADAGVMTDPWEPQPLPSSEPESRKQGLRERAEGVVGGALAGFGLGSLRRSKKADTEPHDEDEEAAAGANRSVSALAEDRPQTALADRADDDAEKEPPVTLAHSEIMSQETEPILPVKERDAASSEAVPTTVLPSTANEPSVKEREQQQPEALNFSIVTAQDFEPESIPAEKELERGPDTPLLPKRSSKRLDALYGDADFEGPEMRDSGTDAPPDTDALPGTENARPGAAFFGAGALAPSQHEGAEPLTPMASSMIPNPLQVKKPMLDEGSQTVVSGDDVEKMLRDKNKVAAAPSVASSSPSRPNTAIGPGGRRSIDGVVAGGAAAAGAVAGGVVANEALQGKQPRRPASAGSMRSKVVAMPPPLPEDHTEKIAAAQGSKASATPGPSAPGTMGPPLMPASAYKGKRPSTPAEVGRTLSKDGTTPRPHRASHSTVASPSKMSRRTSVSSFASECDERFQIQPGGLMYPDDVPPTTDPRMIQAITQTMIGEYLWKYTRKAGRSETSSTRHRRFFWVHPYTRTLYWSEKDPSTAGRDMLKAKSVAIETLRVITDENTYPPGLHRKSIVVVTPGREIVFTAPTGQRHETWFNALSYLLLRTEQEKQEAEDTITAEDVDEFNPQPQGFGSSFRRSISRMTGGTGGGRSQSRLSLSSYNSRTTRNSSPTRQGGPSNSLAARQSAAAARASAGPPTLTPVPARQSQAQGYNTNTSSSRASNGGRLSSFSSRFRPGSAQRGSMTSSRGRASGSYNRGGRASLQGPEAIYDASVAADSAEDVRGQMASQEERAAELENVRACCDGRTTLLTAPFWCVAVANVWCDGR